MSLYVIDDHPLMREAVVMLLRRLRGGANVVELDRLGILSASFVDGIDELHAFPVIRMAAARLVDEFDIPEPRRSLLVADGALGVPGRSLAERQLRAIEETPTTKLKTTTDVAVL